LGNIQILNLDFLTHLTVTHTPLLSFKKLKTAMHVTDVMVPMMKSFSTNVYHVISTSTRIVFFRNQTKKFGNLFRNWKVQRAFLTTKTSLKTRGI